MTYEYRDFYGSKAYITSCSAGWRLKIYAKSYYSGSYWITEDRTYTTFRGARIAMGKMSDGWMQVVNRDDRDEIGQVVLRG